MKIYPEVPKPVFDAKLIGKYKKLLTRFDGLPPEEQKEILDEEVALDPGLRSNVSSAESNRVLHVTVTPKK